MRTIGNRLALLVMLLFAQASYSQMNRVSYNNQQLFLNGSNLAWVNYGSDWGLGTTDATTMANWMLQMHQHGGNAMRVWLNVEGTVTPKFDALGYCTGPGPYVIPQLKNVCDLAWDREIGLNICLWGFGMQTGTLDTSVLRRNRLLLTDTSFTNTYIRNCLIPMVTALKGHPAILAWEIFNEPEGMSNEFGWSGYQRVQMKYIQQFINLCAGAIHRTDPNAKVTNGAWSFYVLTDNALAKASAEFSNLSTTDKQKIGAFYQQKYGSTLTSDEIINRLQKIADGPHQNYYRDDRLIAAGHDPDGTLDFYSVHYYNSSTPLSTSPFHHPASSWNLTKPIVVAEFAMQDAGKGENPPGIAKTSLYETLYQFGYAGALAWSWTDVNLSPRADMLAGMQSMWDNHNVDVKIVHPSGTIISFSATPSIIEKGQSAYLIWNTSEGSSVTLNGIAVQTSDSLQITPDTTTIYKLIAHGSVIDSSSITVQVLPSGAIVTFTATPSNIGVGESSLLKWHVVSGSKVKLNGVTVASDDTLRVYPTGDSTFILSTIGGVFDTSRVIIRIVNRLAVNRALNQPVVASSIESGTSVSTLPALAVDGNRTTRWSSLYSDNQWIYVDLGQRIIVQHVVLYWETAYGKAYTIDVSDDTLNWTTIYSTSSSDGGTDDIAGISGSGRFVRMNGLMRGTQWGFSLYEFEVYGVPAVTGIEDLNSKQLPVDFTLSQNYPNPFNPTTTIRYSLPHAEYVKLFVYDVLGRQVGALVNTKQDAGVYETPFNASLLPSGVYFYRLNIGTFTQTKKMLLLK